MKERVTNGTNQNSLRIYFRFGLIFRTINMTHQNSLKRLFCNETMLVVFHNPYRQILTEGSSVFSEEQNFLLDGQGVGGYRKKSILHDAYLILVLIHLILGFLIALFVSLLNKTKHFASRTVIIVVLNHFF
jgi:hypothetical protein